MDSVVLRLRPSIGKTLILLAISGAFVAIGAYLILRHNSLGGWLYIAFFGLGVLFSVVNLLPNSSYLLLSPTGMELRSLYRKWFIRWTDVQEFFPAKIARRPMVCWHYASTYTQQSLGRRLSSSTTGVDAGLPDTYGMSAETLATLLNEWRTKYAVAP